jgi:1-carboxybiuret hydrolase subunit AtzG-like protein
MIRKAGHKPKPARAKRPRPARAAAKMKLENSVDALVAASAQALGLALDPAWHDSIAFNLGLILRHAALVDEFALPDDAEPAPVFHA